MAARTVIDGYSGNVVHSNIHLLPRSSIPRVSGPGDAPQVKVHGRVDFGTEKNGLKSERVAGLIARNGQRYTLQDSTISEIEEWERKHTRALIHVEGFRLRNGAGNLWIESATGDNGEVILHRSKQFDRLMFRRTDFGKALFLMYGS